MGRNIIIGDLAKIVDKDRYVIQECFDGLYELKKTSGSFWNQIECSKSICSQVIRVNVRQNRGKIRPYLTVHEPFYPQEGSLSMVFNLFSWHYVIEIFNLRPSLNKSTKRFSFK